MTTSQKATAAIDHDYFAAQTVATIREAVETRLAVLHTKLRLAAAEEILIRAFEAGRGAFREKEEKLAV